MILPEDIAPMSNLSPEDLTKLIQAEGYTEDRFDNAKFIRVYVVKDDRTRKISIGY